MSAVGDISSNVKKKTIEEHIDEPRDNAKLSPRLILTVAIVTLSSHFHFGYQLGVPNTAGTVLKEFFNSSYERQFDEHPSDSAKIWIWAIYIGTFQSMAVFGSQLTQHTVDRIGRRGVFLMIAIISTISGVFAYSSYWFGWSELLFISRIGYGLVLGGGMSASSIYLTEITPTKFRGAVNVSGSVMLRTVTIIAFVLGSPSILGTTDNWPNLFLIELIVSIIHLAGVLFFVKESPTYLMRNGRREEAAMVIQQYHGATANFVDVMDSIDEEIKLNSGSMGLIEILRSPTIRRGALLGIVAATTQGVCGSAIISSFSSFFLTNNGLADHWAAWATTAMGVAGLIAVVVLIFTVERFGRRPMLLISLVVLILCNCAMKAIEFVYPHFDEPIWLYVVHTFVLCLFFFAFSLGVGPISWFVASELVPVNARAATQSVASSVCFVFLGTGPLYFIPVYESLRAFAYLTLIIPPFICLIILWKWLPETKQKSIMEIMAILNGIDEIDPDLEKKMDKMNNPQLKRKKEKMNEEAFQMNIVPKAV